jgi:hypothetical protein
MSQVESKNPSVEDLLRKELDEHHQYVRAMFGHLLTWFIFFSNISILVLSWCVATTTKNDPPRLLVSALAIYFILHTLLGIGSAVVSLFYFRTANSRVSEILSAFTQIADSTAPKSPLPLAFYRAAVFSLIAALCLMLGFWICVITILKP